MSRSTCLLASTCRYMCLSCDETAKARWQSLFAEHQFLQRAQKREYATARVHVAMNYPSREAYLAMDGGSGFDFVLPHLSAADSEGPSKALAGSHTVPFKVMNGLVHGDARSHVILSPGVIRAGASYVCECLLIMLNSILEEHGDIPPLLSLQLDNSPVNHNILLLAFCGLFVLEQVTVEARVRFELPNHAHDVYDAFHAIHARRIARTTFYSLSELDELILKAHESSRQRGSGGCSPDMGHDVKLGGWMASVFFFLRRFLRLKFSCPYVTHSHSQESFSLVEHP